MGMMGCRKRASTTAAAVAIKYPAIPSRANISQGRRLKLASPRDP